ncbi:MAG: outer membrane protein transport protein [Candidatus Delongbacteria bacterium]|nr:outer membrane protein transport protein [Candidatus Delongbacteria bacterium]
MKLRLLSLMMVILLVTNTGFGAGFALYEHGGRAIGMAGAFAAIADDASAIYYNPAGLSFIEHNTVMAGLHLIAPKTKFTPCQPFPGGESAVSETQVFTPIHVYGNYHVTPKLSLGAGIFNNFGLGMRWNDDGSFVGRFVSYDATIQYFNFALAASYQLLPSLSLAVGGDMLYGKVILKRNIALFEHSPNSEAGILELEGACDPSFSFNLGLLYKRERWSLGLAYRHEIVTTFNDAEADFTVFNTPLQAVAATKMVDQNVDSEIALPATASIGAAFRLTPKLLLGFTANYIAWSSFEKLEMKFDDSSINSEVKEDYDDTYMLRLGLEYQVNQAFSLRTGYIFDHSPQPKESMSSLLGDADRHDLCIGFGYTFSNFTIDMNYMAIMFNERDTLKDGKPVQYELLDGAYESYAHVLGLSLGYRF